MNKEKNKEYALKFVKLSAFVVLILCFIEYMKGRENTLSFSVLALATGAIMTNPSVKDFHDRIYEAADKKGAVNGLFARLVTKVGSTIGSYKIVNCYFFTLVLREGIIGKPKLLVVGAFGQWWNVDKAVKDLQEHNKQQRLKKQLK